MLPTSNSQGVVAPVQRTLLSAHEMFVSRAYLHQYERHGIGSQDFVNAFAVLEQMIHDYSALDSSMGT